MNPARKYMVWFLFSMIAYAGLLLVSVLLIPQIENQAIQIPVALLPILPVALAVYAFLSFLRQMDELQQRIQLQALGFSFAATAFVTFSVGLLDNAGIPQFGLIWVMPMMIAFWGIGVWLANRYYA